MSQVPKNYSKLSQDIAGISLLVRTQVRGSPGYTLWFKYLYKVTYFTTTVNFKHQNNLNSFAGRLRQPFREICCLLGRGNVDELGLSGRIITGPFILPVSKPDFCGLRNILLSSFLIFGLIDHLEIIYILARALSLKSADSSSVSDQVKCSKNAWCNDIDCIKSYFVIKNGRTLTQLKSNGFIVFEFDNFGVRITYFENTITWRSLFALNLPMADFHRSY